MNQSHYGLTTNKLVDKEWFLNELRLRAINNYGAWISEFSALARVTTAFYDICQDAKAGTRFQLALMKSIKPEIKALVKEMCEDLN